MTAAQQDAILARVDALPALPAAAYRLTRIIQDPDCKLKDVVDTIRFDSSVTAQLLRICNSAYYGLARRIVAVEDAVRLLGMAKVVQLALAAHARTLLNGTQAGYGLSAGALWLHSVAVALAAQKIAQRSSGAAQTTLFTAGLLHDIGKIVLNEHLADAYARVASRVIQEGISFPEAEAAELGYTHAELGARVAEKWQLPDEIVRSIRYHHTPSELDPANPVVDAVHAADVICLLIGVGGGDDGQMYRADEAAIQRIGMNREAFDAIGVEVITELKAVQSQFQVK